MSQSAGTPRGSDLMAWDAHRAHGTDPDPMRKAEPAQRVAGAHADAELEALGIGAQMLERHGEPRSAVDQDPVMHKLAQHPCRGTSPGWQAQRGR